MTCSFFLNHFINRGELGDSWVNVFLKLSPRYFGYL